MSVPQPLTPRLSVAGAPLYRQIRQRLRSGILDGSYSPGSRLPSEAEFGEIFKVSRITIRQALNDLQKEGLIYRVHGKGTFVAHAKAFQNVTRLQGFGEAMAATGHEVLNELHDFHYLAASREIATQLRLIPGDSVVHIRRVRLLDRIPVSLELTWLPATLGPALEHADLVTRDIFLILENDCGTRLGHADISINSTLADHTLAHTLAIAPNSPVLHIERLTHDISGQPVDYEHLYFRGDTFQYRFRTDRQYTGNQS